MSGAAASVDITIFLNLFREGGFALDFLPLLHLVIVGDINRNEGTRH